MHHREEADRPSSLGALEPSRAAWSCPRSSRFEDVRQRQGPGDCLDREQIANQRFSAEERAFGRPWPCKSRIADAPEVAFEDDPFCEQFVELQHHHIVHDVFRSGRRRQGR